MCPPPPRARQAPAAFAHGSVALLVWWGEVQEQQGAARRQERKHLRGVPEQR